MRSPIIPGNIKDPLPGFITSLDTVGAFNRFASSKTARQPTGSKDHCPSILSGPDWGRATWTGQLSARDTGSSLTEAAVSTEKGKEELR